MLFNWKTKTNDVYETPTEQAIQFLQGGAGPGVPAGVLHGARGTANVPAGRDTGGGGRAGAVGGVRGAGMLQVHGAQRRGGQGILHGLRLRGHTFVVVLFSLVLRLGIDVDAERFMTHDLHRTLIPIAGIVVEIEG